jgi:2-amino-4-hydroxy-6-hydroxymethyldihydropteridine diphosphokinase
MEKLRDDTTQVYLSLGGNQEHSLQLLKSALEKLALLDNEQTLRVSPFYYTSPIGDEKQNHYINAVCMFQTGLPPKILLQKTQQIEKELGKIPKPKWASRPIDIDIIFYGNECYKNEDLEIPHLHWKERLFVLVPLADLISSIQIKREGQVECYFLRDLIQNLLSHSQQEVSLLEKKDRVD